jgi:mono/diheme cytochrome c family protein
MKILYPLLALVFLAACQSPAPSKAGFLSTDSLPAQVVQINTDADTVLTTFNGALISIAKGSLQTADGNKIASLEIKEAYSMEQIIHAGLTTRSNGEPLSSGGMIYINAAAGTQVKIAKKIGVKIPTSYYNEKMQVYRGNAMPNGKINWTDPEPLKKDTANALYRGRILFNTNCASCHAIGHDVTTTGPDLAYILTKTNDREKLYAFTKNNLAVLASDPDPYYRCLYYSKGKAAMNLFTGLTDQELDALYGYIENESITKHLPLLPNTFRKSVDSCKNYRHQLEYLQQKRRDLERTGRKEIEQNVQSPTPSADTVGPPLKVSPFQTQTLYYEITVEGFGWYNIDVLLKDAGAVQSKLMVRMTGSFSMKAEIFLVIPSVRVYEQGGLLEGKNNLFGFYQNDGTIYLPPNLNAYVVAIGEADGQIVFASSNFFTSADNQLELSPSVISKSAFDAAIRALSLADLQFTAKETSTGIELKKIDGALEQLELQKPKNCDCHCLDVPSDTSLALFEK